MGVTVTVANVVVVATPAFCNAYFNIYTSLIILTNIPLKYKKEPYVNKIYYTELYIFTFIPVQFEPEMLPLEEAVPKGQSRQLLLPYEG